MPDPERPRLTYRWLIVDQRAVKIVLTLLVVADLLLFAVHWYAAAQGTLNPVYFVDKDLSYAEVFQYFKLTWLLALVALYVIEHRSWQVAMWLPAFAYFLGDDALQFHERGGRHLARTLELSDALGLRAVDFGELLITGAAGLVLAIPLIVGYLHGDARTRGIYQGFVVLVGVLLFFGVVMDMIHILAGPLGRGSPLGFVEDGGEMLSITAMVAFALRLSLSGGQPGFPVAGRERDHPLGMPDALAANRDRSGGEP